MRSEAEIRSEVLKRFHRWVFLVLNGGLWVAAVFILSQMMPARSFGTTLNGLIVLSMLAWTGLLGLHFLRTIYVELREWLVRRAVERERQLYLAGYFQEKRKRREAPPRLGDDGDLVDFPADEDETVEDVSIGEAKVKYGQ